jgi:ComF family protein
LLHRLKFQEQLLQGHALGSLLARHPSLQDLRVDAVVPVPLHDARLTQRGYNQAMELARPVAAALGRPLEPRWLIRTRNTPPQRGKGKDGRRENILHAFTGVHHPKRSLRGKDLLLLDDIMTTGATLADATRALLEAGAGTVHVAVVSRTARWGAV